MPITELLERNAALYGDMVCLTEINPEQGNTCELAWKELALVETARNVRYRKELTWRAFDDKANQFANLLLAKHIQRGEKVGVLLMNCIEWLPIYFGVLKCGAIVVPLNFRYSSDEIKYALDLADVRVLVFGPEFLSRVEAIKGDIGKVDSLIYVGDGCPDYARSYELITKNQPAISDQ